MAVRFKKGVPLGMGPGWFLMRMFTFIKRVWKEVMASLKMYALTSLQILLCSLMFSDLSGSHQPSVPS